MQADERTQGRSASQKFGVDTAHPAPQHARKSGDADLPGLPSLADRRIKMDNVISPHPFALCTKADFACGIGK